MIPPVDSQVLADNPEFAKLYATLRSDILNSDGSTRDDAEARRLQTVRQKVDRQRLDIAKNSLIEHAVRNVSPAESSTQANSTSQLSLADILLLLPSLLDEENPMSAENAHKILSGSPFSEFETLLPEVAALVSAQLHSSALSVASIVHPSISSSQLHRHIPSLPDNVIGLRAEVDEAEQALVEKRLEGLQTLVGLLDDYAESVTLLLQIMEERHGPIAQNLELKATEVSLQARLAELESTATLHSLRRDMYPPEAITALQNYLTHLKDAKVRTKERVRGLQAELAEYSVSAKWSSG